MTSKTISIAAGVLFGLSQILVFLSMDSEPRPSTSPIATAAMICLAASVVAACFGLRRAAREKRQRDLIS